MSDLARNGTGDLGARWFSEGETYASFDRADKAALMVDGEEYFAHLRSAILQASQSVVIVGWDIDSQVDLAPHLHDGSGVDSEGVPTRLKPLLEHIVAKRPELHVWLLLWDFTPLFVREREPLPTVNLQLTTSDRIHTRMDDALPFGACHHCKIVVIDDALAFCGGLDVTRERWDTSEHRPDDPRRQSPKGGLYAPFHDTHMAVSGAPARALGKLVRRRWRAAGPGEIPDVKAPETIWPSELEPHFFDIDIALSITEPSLENGEPTCQIEALFARAIGQAEELVYIENQFLTAPSVAEALANRLRDRPSLEAVIVTPAVQNTWLETKSMGSGRRLFQAELDEKGVLDRATIVAPVTRNESGDEASVMVHSKLMIVDDQFLTVGSANLNRRSMRFDTEANLALVADTLERRTMIAGLRDRLLAEHLGVEAQTLRDACSKHGSLRALISSKAETYRDGTGAGRALLPIEEPDSFDLDPATNVLMGLADPDRQLNEGVIQALGLESVPAFRPRLQRLAMFAALVVLIGVGILWTMTPLADFTDVDRLGPLFERISGSPWTPVLVALVYMVASLTMFPITVMLILTALTFEPTVAILYAVAGTTLGATVTYGIGWWGGRKLVHRLMGHRLATLSGRIGEQGVLAVVALRITPIAPFTLINLVAGATHIKPVDFIIGTAVGLLPSVVALTIVGESLWGLLSEPTASRVAVLIGVVVGWLFLSVGLQRLINKLTAENDEAGTDR